MKKHFYINPQWFSELCAWLEHQAEMPMDVVLIVKPHDPEFIQSVASDIQPDKTAELFRQMAEIIESDTEANEAYEAAMKDRRNHNPELN